jgi:hypothetical protein
MSPNGLPPPAPPCLWRPQTSRPGKGGTLIVAEVGDLAAHERRRCDPDGYRPARCPGCDHDRLHVHDYPERKRGRLTLVRYVCAACGATWRMVPGYVARMLWWSWPEVEAETLEPAPPTAAARVPGRTVRRWQGRLASAARELVGMMLAQGDAAQRAVAALVSETATRLALVWAEASRLGTPVTERLARLAATLHALVPGVRLM